jgi:hypothetical protein
MHSPVLTDDDGRPVRGEWQPILDAETWEAVVRVLADPARKPSLKGRSGVRSLGGGLFRCPCGNVLRSAHVARLGYSKYECQPATRQAGVAGPHSAQRAEWVDRRVQAVIIKRLSRSDLADMLTADMPDLRPLRIEQGNKRAALVRLGEDYDNDMITREEWLARRGKLTARLAEIDAALADADTDSVLAPFASGRAAEVWEGLDNAQRRAVIDALCTVTVHPAGRGARVFNPDTVTIKWRND